MQLCCIKQHGRAEIHKLAVKSFYRPDLAPQVLALEMARSDVELFSGAVPQLSDIIRVSSWVLNPTSFKSMASLSLTETFLSRRAEAWTVHDLVAVTGRRHLPS